jgi:hypothetical protein
MGQPLGYRALVPVLAAILAGLKVIHIRMKIII